MVVMVMMMAMMMLLPLHIIERKVQTFLTFLIQIKKYDILNKKRCPRFPPIALGTYFNFDASFGSYV